MKTPFALRAPQSHVQGRPATTGAPESRVALELTGLRKEYSGQPVVNDVDLAVNQGEFVTLLGPSGSGKTSILMMIAGFVIPEAGSIAIGGRPATNTSPHQRNIGLVFQNYALFPHMTVADNLAFPLKMRHLPKSQISRKVDEMLDLVDLAEKAHQRPASLSGGQQQRVALARALVFDPAVVLLDEPLSALDRKLRERLQLEIKRIQRKMNATIILVTHDRDEALTMSDRIAVMRSGSILQCDRPEVIYERPQDRFVAEFLGESNLLCGRVRESTPSVISVEDQDLGVVRLCPDPGRSIAAGEWVSAIVRPERMALCRERRPNAVNQFAGRVTEVVYVGDAVRYQIECGNKHFVVKLSSMDAAALSLHEGSEAYALWTAADAVALDREPLREADV
ncbi:ABC transporter ATP-binding protein [Kribbella sp. NPDC059898]|uniref:ABC transporter ATP-binding protein n=1 Tax=Kribbella sp. NPDC059898 TaxID=3346995 RepID=UPI0036568281